MRTTLALAAALLAVACSRTDGQAQPNPAPVVTSLSPASAAAGEPDKALVVEGSGFVGASTVHWAGSGGEAALPTSYGSAARLAATVPASRLALAGTADVTVVSPPPGGGTSNAVTFTIVAPTPVPVLAGLDPAGAIAGSPALTLAVSGSNFTSQSAVQWNAVALATAYVSDTALTATVPAAALASAGTASVTVVTPGAAASNALVFSIVNPVPVISSIEPQSAVAGGPGFTLVVNGSNFIPSSVVDWDASPLDTTYQSNVRLTAAVPAADIASAGTASITVVNPAGGASSQLQFGIPGGNQATTWNARAQAQSGAVTAIHPGVVDRAAGAAGDNVILATASGNAVHLSYGKLGVSTVLSSPSSWTNTANGSGFTYVEAFQDKTGKLHAFANTYSNAVYWRWSINRDESGDVTGFTLDNHHQLGAAASAGLTDTTFATTVVDETGGERILLYGGSGLSNPSYNLVTTRQQAGALPASAADWVAADGTTNGYTTVGKITSSYGAYQSQTFLAQRPASAPAGARQICLFTAVGQHGATGPRTRALATPAAGGFDISGFTSDAAAGSAAIVAQAVDSGDVWFLWDDGSAGHISRWNSDGSVTSSPLGNPPLLGGTIYPYPESLALTGDASRLGGIWIIPGTGTVAANWTAAGGWTTTVVNANDALFMFGPLQNLAWSGGRPWLVTATSLAGGEPWLQAAAF